MPHPNSASSVRDPASHWINVVLPLAVLALFCVLRLGKDPADSRPQELAKAARDSIASGKWDEAKKATDSLLALFPNNHIYLRQAARVAHEQNRYGDEAELLERFMKTAPQASDACPDLPQAYRRQELYDRAIEMAKKCTELEPKNSDFRFELALTLERAGKTDEALALYSAGVKEFPTYSDFAIGQARMLLRLGKVEESRALIEKVLAEKPTNADAELVAGLAATTAGDFERAREILAKAVEEHPTYEELKAALEALPAKEAKP